VNDAKIDARGMSKRMAIGAVTTARVSIFSSRVALLFLALAASWPIVAWYVRRLGDGGDEPWGLLALIAAVVLTPRALWRLPVTRREIAVVGLAVAGAASSAGAPMLVRAGVLMLGVGCALAAKEGGAAGRVGLLCLSLPVMASVQFFAGYPLRVLTAELGRPMLALAGVATQRAGVVLSWAGGEVVVDAPCGGVRMLWAALVAACALAAWRRLEAGRTVLMVSGALIGALVANTLRAAGLFLVETGRWPGAGAWLHEAVGMACFGGVMLGLERSARRGGRICRTDEFHRTQKKHRHPWVLLGLLALAAVWPLVRAGEPAPGASLGEKFPGWPELFEGRPLVRLSPGDGRGEFASGFAGETGVFRQGEHVIVLRWLRAASRGVHPAADCFRARGYRVKPGGLVRDERGARWAEFIAVRGDERWRVRERWRDEQGAAWTDVSAWWWAAQAAGARGPWWGEMVAKRE
jgi:exosortase/archaeosortase family protein